MIKKKRKQGKKNMPTIANHSVELVTWWQITNNERSGVTPL